MNKNLPLATVMLALASLPALAEEARFPLLETSGYGEVIATPDMAEFSVRVEASTRTAKQAKAEVDEVVAAFMKRLSRAGVDRDDISATNIQLVPKYRYPKSGEPELIGYKASRSITVTVNELEKLNTYLDGALGDGINRIDNIRLKVRDQQKYQQLARLAAIKDANEKAEALADGFNTEIEGLWRIRYNQRSTQPVIMKAMAMDNRMESGAGYQDTTLVVSDRVEVVYRLED